MHNKSTLNESIAGTCQYGHAAEDNSIHVSVACLFLTLGTAAFLSNIFIDYIIWKMYLYRIVGHLFILSLSVSDIIQGTLIMTIHTTELLAGEGATFFRSQMWCRFSAGLALLTILSTVYNIVLITFDRVIAIFLPLHYHEIMNAKRAKIIIAALWLYMAVWCSLPLWGWAKESECMRPPHTICDWGVTLNDTFFSITGVLVVVSVLAVAVQQIAMLILAVRHINKLKLQPGQKLAFVSKKQSKVTRRVSFIVLVFAMTYIPWFFVVVRTLVSGLGGQAYIYMCNILIYLNSSLNPWIYALTDREIRKKIAKCIFSVGRSKVAPFTTKQLRENAQRSTAKPVFSIT